MRPVGLAPDPDCDATEAVKLTGCPCVTVVGVTLLSVVADGSSVTELHFVTRLLTSTVPSPVARSYFEVALCPVRTPYECPETEVVQFGVPFAQGIAIVPEVMSWNAVGCCVASL